MCIVGGTYLPVSDFRLCYLQEVESEEHLIFRCPNSHLQRDLGEIPLPFLGFGEIAIHLHLIPEQRCLAV